MSFEQRKLDHAQRHLRLELIKRYAEHDRTDNEIVKSLAEQSDIHKQADAEHPILALEAISRGEQTDAPSILMIGDIFTDAFIKLDEDYAFVEKDEEGNEWLKLPFGSKPPYVQADIVRSVGPSPNAAISCARLGLRASLMAWLGDDQYGKESLGHLKSENVETESMVTEEGTPSSYWFVLRHGTDRTMLVKSESYKYEWKAPASKPDWLYLAYIGENSWHFHEGLAEYLEENQDVQFVFQPATYHFEWGVEKLAQLYRRANVLVLNREEAMQVTGKPHDDLKVLASALHELGPEIVAVTDGAHGSYVSSGEKLVTVPNYPDPAPPVDRTGAGDAFASTFVAGLALGKDLEEALRWAPVNSASVVQKVGAQGGLLKMDELQQWLEKAPDDYQISEV